MAESVTTGRQLRHFFLLGMPSWALVNGTWASLAALAANVPEGYNISAYLILSLTLGNVLPFYLGQKSYMYSKRQLARIMYVIQVVGLVAGMLMAVFWDYSVTVGKDELSIPLFVLFFVIGACSASTSVTYFTYVAKYSPLCTTYLSTGMGAGSFIAGFLSILQANLLEAKIYLSILFAIVSCMFIPAFVALYLLESEDVSALAGSGMLKYQDEAEATERTPLKSNNTSNSTSTSTSTSTSNPGNHTDDNYTAAGTNGTNDNKAMVVWHVDSEAYVDGMKKEFSESVDSYVEADVNTRNLVKFEEWNVVRANMTLLIFVGIMSFLGHGLVPTIISSVAGRFDRPTLTLSFTTGEAAMCDPIFRFYTAYIRFESLRSIYNATYVLIILSLGMLLLNMLPSSWTIFSESLGGLLLVFLNVSFVTLFVFTNTSSFLYLKENVSEKHIGYAYKWNGLSIQVGAVVGSLLSVLLFMTGVI
jgi:hypothetical protein